MNKERRKKLKALIARLDGLYAELESLKDEEADYRHNMPISFVGTDAYEQADKAASALENAVDYLDSAGDEIDGAIGAKNEKKI